MTLDHVRFGCWKCGLTLDADVGRADGGYDRAFWCPEEERLLTLDVDAPGFTGRCPSCHGMLDLLADFPLTSCPRCHVATPSPPRKR